MERVAAFAWNHWPDVVEHAILSQLDRQIASDKKETDRSGRLFLLILPEANLLAWHVLRHIASPLHP